MTGIYVSSGYRKPEFPHKLNFDHVAICRALAAGEIPKTNPKIVLLDACLAAIRTRPAAERDKGVYKPGVKQPSAETIFGTDLYDVYRNLGGTLSIRSRGFYELARECATLCGIHIGKHQNFEMKMYRATRP
jgi:hypothetical protein